MSRIKRKTFMLLAALVGVVALLGASLGLAVAGTTNLSSGFNLVGGPIGGDVPPDKFVSCIQPTTAWVAVYIWDAQNQEWLHFFNTSASSIPSFVNQSGNGGITVIPRFSGVALLMASAVSNAKLLDSNSASCS